ncbi:MAG: lipopolysaccharide kinase InaA family protein [Fimbriiglobus sp.]
MLSHFVRRLRGLFHHQATTPALGYHWRAEPSAHDWLSAWSGWATGVVVKENLQRTILHVPAEQLFVKISRVNTPRSYARDVLRPCKAQLEYENALALREHGIATVTPLAWGTRSRFWPSESVLVTREAVGAKPLVEVLESGMTSVKARFALADRLALALAKQHEAGVDHPDPHPGNFLIDEHEILLMDLHAIRFGPALDSKQTLAALVLWNRWFQLRATRSERLRFWRTYRQARPALSLDPRTIEASTRTSNLAFWQDRLKRYTTTNRDTRPIRQGRLRGYAERTLPEALQRRLLTDPDGFFTDPAVKLLKDSRSSTVAILSHENTRYVVKRFRIKNRVQRLKNALRTTPAMRSWCYGRNLLDRGLPTARPMAVVERFAWGVPTEGYLIFEYIDDGIDLPEAVTLACHSVETLRLWSDRIARELRKMHDHGVSHRDLKAPNLFLRGISDLPTATPVILDLVGVEVGKDVPMATRCRDLARLNASFLSGPITQTDKLRFLKAYLGPHEDWKPWWQTIATATATKVAKNTRTGRPLA